MTPEELSRRRSVVGASEVGLLFGLPSFGGRTVSDLWFEKKFGTVHGGKGNASTKLGNKLEPVVLEMAEERLGTLIVDRQKWVTRGSNGATLDGRAENSGAVVEASRCQGSDLGKAGEAEAGQARERPHVSVYREV